MVKGTLGNGQVDENSDEFALKNNFVSVTPIQFDLTDKNEIQKLKEWNLE